MDRITQTAIAKRLIEDICACAYDYGYLPNDSLSRVVLQNSTAGGSVAFLVGGRLAAEPFRRGEYFESRRVEISLCDESLPWAETFLTLIPRVVAALGALPEFQAEQSINQAAWDNH